MSTAEDSKSNKQNQSKQTQTNLNSFSSQTGFDNTKSDFQTVLKTKNTTNKNTEMDKNLIEGVETESVDPGLVKNILEIETEQVQAEQIGAAFFTSLAGDNLPDKYIFVTGGVVSGLGKGITAASIGLILKENGILVDATKFDPYLNIDPGTMSPHEHGEVYVLHDGSETDLDLGHYERFLDTNLNSQNSVTAGKIYAEILRKERHGDYLGKNVQLIPDVTEYIKNCFAAKFGPAIENKFRQLDKSSLSGAEQDQGAEQDSSNLRSGKNLQDNTQNQGYHRNMRVRIIEIGGSSGDIEGEVFLESFRQFRRQNKGKCFHVHLGYVPFLGCSGEYKTKPIQSSIRELLKAGLQPDLIVARFEPNWGDHQDFIDNLYPVLDSKLTSKIALFANLPPSQVISLPDLKSIYEVPLYLQKTSLIHILNKFLNYKPEIQDWDSGSNQTNSNLEQVLSIQKEKLNTVIHPQIHISPVRLSPIKNPFFENYQLLNDYLNQTETTLKVGIIAKYTKLTDSYLSIIESLKIAATAINTRVEILFIDSQKLETDNFFEGEWLKLKSMQAILVPGGFGGRGMWGKVLAISYARAKKIPFLGICLGMQMAVVEGLRYCASKNAISREMLSQDGFGLEMEIPKNIKFFDNIYQSIKPNPSSKTNSMLKTFDPFLVWENQLKNLSNIKPSNSNLENVLDTSLHSQPLDYHDNSHKEGDAEPKNKQQSQQVWDIAIDFMPGQINIDKGGSMRLGDWRCQILEGKILDLYTEVYGRREYYLERHRHRLEVQPEYILDLQKIGYHIVGRHYPENGNSQAGSFESVAKVNSPSTSQSETKAGLKTTKQSFEDEKTQENQNQQFLVEMIELDSALHPYFVATQSHPEFLSRPGRPHPLFLGLLRSAKS